MLIVWKLDRLGRDLQYLIETAEELRQRQINFKVLADAGAEIDTTTANGRLLFAVFTALAEYERELILERTKAGLKAARVRGRLGGWPRKIDATAIQMAMQAISAPTVSAREVADRLGISIATLCTYVNGDGSLEEAGERLLAKAVK